MSHYNKPKELKSILKKYLQHTASPEESEAVDSWYQNLGVKNDEVPVLDHPVSKSELENSIKGYLKAQLPRERKKWFLQAYLKYAAAIILISGVGLFLTNRSDLKDSSKNETTIFSGRRTQKKITLADGSEIVLNMGSKLVIAKDFGEHDRNVSLSGEAFFDIAKDKTKPFIIHTANISTRVVGTSFNINAYPDLEKIKVAVFTGKVRVAEQQGVHKKIIALGMTQGETLSYYKSTGKSELRTEDTGPITSWRDNKLYIDNANINDIAKQLERYYDIKVIIKSKTNADDRYNIRFKNESMRNVLEILSMLTKRQFIYQTNQIIIK
ncbi:FecR family protein [Pedobacter duraquae]|uniref:FecR family protein n=1 Tax=Pedobacter duraquae TaxID=425511 RepID=A0A4R6IMH3_9SPHI|nr:FecR family protein [Pedobacter duraquae]TDO23353.1 FecR family protein [Pedobacter duraquae]